jgi:CheY-like chemotaxis protein
MNKQVREYIDFWIENSVHASEQDGARGSSQDVAALVARLIEGASEEGISEQAMRDQVGDLTEFVASKLAAANQAEDGHSDRRESVSQGKAMRMFLVEDEALILMMTTDMVESLGHTVVAKASSLEQAMGPAQSADFDLAILDVNIAGENVGPIADIIAGRGLPFVFVTGYAENALPAAFRARPYLQKPYQAENLQAAIEAAVKA